MKRAFVTGATGFIGANLVKYLVETGYEVTGFTRHADASRLDDVISYIDLEFGDVRDFAAVFRALRHARPDYVFHLASYGVHPKETDVLKMAQVNAQGTINVFTAAHKVGCERFLHAASAFEYGVRTAPALEWEAREPITPYGTTKLMGSEFVQKVSLDLKLPSTVLNLFNVYGPMESEHRLFTRVIDSGLKRKAAVYSDPDLVRDFVYVKDVCEAFVRAAHTVGGGMYNVCTGVGTKLSEVAEIAREEFDLKQEPTYTGITKDTDRFPLVGSNKKMYTAFGWAPSTPLAVGFAKTVAQAVPL